VKLSEWAKTQGITYKTAWKWFQAGTLPIRAEQRATGTIIVYPPAQQEVKVVLYARVSSGDQKSDLDRQIARLVLFANEQKLPITQTLTEIGSGLNGRRLKMLKDKSITMIIVEHRDRLMRLGCEYVEAALSAQDRRLIVIEQSELKEDLVRDMIEVLTSFCARLYGRRAAKNKAQKALEAMERGDENS
jgi:Predicted site-specific integrase-resolvase